MVQNVWMKRIGLLVCLILSTTVIPYANADEVVIQGFATLDYPTKVKLRTSGCQTISISYVTDDNLARENSVFLVQLVHKSKKVFFSGATWFSNITSYGPDALPAMSRIGTLNLKICRKPWVMGTGPNKEKIPAVTPGLYRLYFAGGYVDADTGEKIGEKIEVTKSIKLS